MTHEKKRKRVIRQRMQATGENYTATQAALSAHDATAGPAAATERVRTPLDELMRAAFQYPERLGHTWLGPEHGLLAILDGPEDDMGRMALVDAGMSAAVIEQIDVPAPTGPSEGGTVTNPAWHQVFGRAQGIAASLGGDDPASVHFLLGMLWDKTRWARYEDAVPRTDVVAALAQLGAVLPPAPMPPLDRPKFTQRVDLPRTALAEVLDVLKEQFDAGGPRFGFNHKDDENSWVNAEDGVDLQSIVDEVVARQPDA